MTKEQLRVLMGENIRNERMARNLSIDELAESLSLTPGFVGLIERGRRGATAHTLSKLSEIYGIPIDGMFRASKDKALSMAEGNGIPANRKKIASLIVDLTEKELEFVVKVVKGLKVMNHNFELLEDEED